MERTLTCTKGCIPHQDAHTEECIKAEAWADIDAQMYSGEEIEAQALVAAYPTIKEAYKAARQKQAQFVPGSDPAFFWERVSKLI